ncbi:YALI0C07546p [Yarrowia lipolytica CLIB122]|uniref:YALI0C07546p n=1 Tax=Yarrowia lipolytica (strain CLIB 122 / E 150) TaxID=284591 RepID=Q6CCQ2_YARLI|nr:YALI0C07546p [Yarrowia lipolytica CLIB122]CAG81863.1 YALI0C07546p [Yarrowia lipolytica CLIB122]|eukprot:XP_501560.1 YALI0C07546p [Yarrowia lipolytica CLIB122]
MPHHRGFDVASYRGYDENGELPAKRIKSTKKIILNAFVMFTPTHLNFGLWTHPDHSKFGRDFAKRQPWQELAKTLEKGKFHAIFIADHLGFREVYGDGDPIGLEKKIQFPCHDPLFLVPIMASVTDHLNFGITVSTSYTPPFTLARQFSTLDHLTDGRIGWNIVTSNSDSASRNFGLEHQVEHDDRYKKADEYMDVVYKLWESSWAEDAVIKGLKTDAFDTSKINYIDHEGKHFKVKGPAVALPSVQRTPVLFQAGMSSAGRAFAGKHAEAVFIAGPSPQLIRQTVNALRESAGDRKLLVVSTLMVIVKATNQEAQDYYKELSDASDKEGALIFCSQMFGADLKSYPPGQDLRETDNPNLVKAVSMWASQTDSKDEVWDVDKVANEYKLAGRGGVAVGDAETVADIIEDWIEIGDLDGFNLSHATFPGTYDDIVGYLIPELQKRGRFHEDYPENEHTFRELLYDTPGNSYLRSDHYGFGFKT